MLTDIALIILTALLGNHLFKKAGFPGILGMVLAGILLGPGVFDLIDDEILNLLKEFKTVALIVILIRAGLGISKTTLNRIGGPAIRMGFIPCLLEGIAATAAAYFVAGLPFFEAGMLGFILAAVSPAVVVPSMLKLKERGFGKNKEVPTLVLAGASLDDVIAITMFGMFAGLAAGASTSWTSVVLGIPGGVIAGAVIGGAIGFVLAMVFQRFKMQDAYRVMIFMIVAVVFYELAEQPRVKAVLPIAALLGIMAMGFVILETNSELADRLAGKFGQIWLLAEILLFVYIGTEVQLDKLDAGLVGIGLLILIAGLLARSVGVWISLINSDLNARERLFCTIAYLPKATVQAAMGAVPLTMVMEGRMTSMTEESGEFILAIAVLSIVVTAPLGAIGIKLSGPHLLSKDAS